MSHMFSIVCDRWNRRNEWQARNARENHMDVRVICPVCGPPNTKVARGYLIAGNRRHWIRFWGLDSCRCILTPMQNAYVIRSARQEGQPIEEH